MKLAAIVLAATLLLANAQCLLACTTAPYPSLASSTCHHRQQSAPAPESCVHALVIDLAPSPAKADLVEAGVIAGFAALLWPRGEGSNTHLRDSRQRNADRGKGSAKPHRKITHENVQRETR